MLVDDDQAVFLVPHAQKRTWLLHVLGDEAVSHVLVFTRTRNGENSLAGPQLFDFSLGARGSVTNSAIMLRN